MKNVLQVMNEINNKYRFSVETSHILIGDQTHDLLKIEIEKMNFSNGLSNKLMDDMPEHIITFMGIPLRQCPQLPERSYVVIGSNNQIIGYGNL